MTITQHIRQHIYATLGMVESTSMPDLTTLRHTERSNSFEQARSNRKILGAFRYGRLGADGKPQWNRVPDMIRRLTAYQSDGNLEHLVDVANLCECEWVEGEHPQRHFTPSDDGEHTQPQS